MSQPADGLLVVPPPGPLCWLFPELEARFDDEPVAVGVEPVLEAAMGAGAQRIRVQAGPRGAVLISALRQACRRRGLGIAVDPTEALGPSFEARLFEHPDRRALDGLHPRAWELGGVPFFDTDPFVETGRVHTRLQPSFWGVLPGDVWTDAERTAWLGHLAARRPDVRLGFLALENLALAGLDPYREMLEAPVVPGAGVGQGRGARPLILGVDGIDGAGKSTCLDGLERWLTARGLRVARHKIYRHGVFHETVTDMTRACAGDRALHLWPLQRHVKLVDSLKYRVEHLDDLVSVADPPDVLLFDRYVETHLAAGAGRYHHDPQARLLLQSYPRADRVFVLDLPVEESLRRLARRSERTVDENPYMLGRFRDALLDVARASGHVVLDARLPVEEIERRVRAEVEELLTRWRPGA